MNRINNLSLPATILIGCVVLGGFYYFAEVSKQSSMERQQQMKLQAEEDAAQKEREAAAWDKLQKSSCVTEAVDAAKSQYEETCTYNCKDGYYYTANYDSYYEKCLQRKGLD